ncbi:MAG TPA: hypothetical protein VKK31_15040 [Thermoanaerobaculia bacterium]|nr:hypothetical protein [Thermoanaerobaculia bacterium]
MNLLGATWGVEPAETAIVFPCDRLDGGFEADYYRGVTVHALPATVFRWLCQLRAAPYSYDWVDNWGRRSPRNLIPGLENLAVGQTVMTIFDLVDFESESHLTIRIKPDSPAWRLFGDVAGSYLIVPGSGDGCRLLAKLRVRYPKGLKGHLMRAVLPSGDLVMMRRQLLNLKALAETSSAPAGVL